MEVAASFVPISDRSAVGAVRRQALTLADGAGFDEEASGRVAIVATELASNVVKHGTRGHCFLSLADPGGEPLVQIVVVDAGSGLADPGRALQDGYSTAGTPGTGLGAVRRLSQSFDLFSQTEGGVVAVARVGRVRRGDGAAAIRPTIEVGAVEAALQGEPVSGDAWAMAREGETLSLLVADGLGHGPLAAEAARVATDHFGRLAGRSPRESVERIHEAMRATRGAAIAVAHVDAAARTVRYAGIGNIAAQIVTDERVQSLVSMNGTAGHIARTMREFSYDFPPGALLVAHTDGISSRWTIDRYPGLALRDPALIAGVLHRDFARGRDDAAIVVVRHAGSAPMSARAAEGS